MEYKGVQKVNSFTLNNNELKQVIEKYFLDKTNQEVKFITKSKKEIQGYFGNESEYAKTRYFIEQDVSILGITKKAEIELSEEDIKQILKEALPEYEITYVSFKSGFNYETIHEIKTPVFREVRVHFIQKEQIKGFNSILDITDVPEKRPQSMYDPKNPGGYYEDWSLRRKF